MSIFRIHFDIEKSILINSNIEKIWENLLDTDKKNLWSPWIIFEKNCEQKKDGIPGNIGYREYWNGNIIGEGEQIITDIKQNEYIIYDINFLKPFKSKNIASFNLIKISENEIKLTWKMKGYLPLFLFFLKKMMSVFIGNDFDRGLKMFKKFIETGKLETETKYVGIDKLNKKFFIGAKLSGKLDDLESKMSNDFSSLINILKEHNIKPISFFSRYTKTDMINNYYEFEACVEISETDYSSFELPIVSTYYFGVLESNKVAVTTHYGSYDFLGNSWTGAYMFVKANKLKVNKKYSPIEIYENGFNDGVKEKDYITHIMIPVK